MSSVKVMEAPLRIQALAFSPCVLRDECSFHNSNGSNGCDAPGTKHSECGFYEDPAERAQWLTYCVTCGQVEVAARGWITPHSGGLTFKPDAEGVYAWKLNNNSLLGNIPGVFCPTCRPQKI